MTSKESGSNIVRLNIGGTVFATSSSTLLSGGESFFTGLLSGRHESARDHNGAYFIDRSPRYFELILQYLRSNVLEIPSGFSPTILQKEAEFYGIQKIVDHLEHDRKKKEEVKEQGQVFPVMKNVGCYVDESNDHVFMFGPEGKLTYITGTQAYTQAMVIQNHPQVPDEWKSDQSQARSFAVFYEAHVKKGTYKMNKEGQGLLLTLPGPSSSGHSLTQHLGTLSKDLSSLCVTSFSCAAGSGLFMCNHANPHHFHLYKLKKF